MAPLGLREYVNPEFCVVRDNFVRPSLFEIKL